MQTIPHTVSQYSNIMNRRKSNALSPGPGQQVQLNQIMRPPKGSNLNKSEV